MSQLPPPSDDDVRLSEEEIRAMSAGLRSQYMSDERGVAGTVGNVVASRFEAVVKRLLLLFRLPILVLSALGGFLFFNGREGFSFFLALAAALIVAIVVAALHGAIIRLIDVRAYRREIGH